MLSAHETVKQGWNNFKGYPKLKAIILFLFISMIPVLIMEYNLPEDGRSLGQIIGLFLLSIPSMIIGFLAQMAVVHYTCGNWVFDGFREFLRPPSRRWAYIWKTFVVVFCVIAPLIFLFIIVSIAAGIIFAKEGLVFGIVISLLLLPLIYYFIKYSLKIAMVAPYFAMNDRASLFSSLRFSDGYIRFLLKVSGWVVLYGLLFILALFIILMILGFIATLLGTVGTILLVVFVSLIQLATGVLIGFITAATYKEIASPE